MGGKVECAYLSFRDYDLVFILDMPNNVNVAAISLAFSAGEALSAIKTTVLLTTEEEMEQ